MRENIEEAVNYLRMRGFDVGDYGTDRSHMGFPVNGKFLTQDRVLWLATIEGCKDESVAEKPDGLGLSFMANGCLTIAEHPSTPPQAADEGRDLAKQFETWKNSEIDFPVARLRILCDGMAHFLTSWFRYLWPQDCAI